MQSNHVALLALLNLGQHLLRQVRLGQQAHRRSSSRNVARIDARNGAVFAARNCNDR
jgi:hypothetical protein